MESKLHVYEAEKKKNQPEEGEVERILYWYGIFVFVIPITIIHLISFDSTRYYFAIIDIIANIFANIDHGKWLGRLYSPLPGDLVAYFSTNFLSLLALAGASWTAIKHAFALKSVFAGVFIAMILFTFTYLLPIQTIGYVMRHYSSLLDSFFNFTSQTNSFLMGTGLLVLFMIVENLGVSAYFYFLQKV